MKRLLINPRMDWRERVESVGMTYHSIGSEPYWDESACYQFSPKEIDCLNAASAELHSLCLQAVKHVIANNLFSRLQVPERFVPLVVGSWEMDEPSIYGRLDLGFDGSGPPKLLEYSGDSPISLLEASVVQWFWLQECFRRGDQFNSIHEKLIGFWEKCHCLDCNTLHFACASGNVEQLGNLEYMRDTAVQAGFATKRLFIEQIAWDEAQGLFVDPENEPIRVLFKLYPWESLVGERIGARLSTPPLRLIEPAWKMLLSSKALLPILWELFPGHPNLSEPGSDYRPLPEFNGNYPVIGSWIIGGEPAGIGIRENCSAIISNGGRFIPHYFQEG